MRVWQRWLALALLMLSSGTDWAVADELPREYRIKAAFLYNLTKFITWPDEKSWSADVPVTICIYGFNPFDAYLDKLSERTAKSHPIAVRYLLEKNGLEKNGLEKTALDKNGHDTKGIEGCQIVFISQYNTASSSLLQTLSTTSQVLTVGDDPDFIAHNGLIGLVSVGNNVQMDIHLTRARQAGFGVSASLLEIAHKIE